MPICSYGKYCYSMSDEHWSTYTHPGRSSRTKIRLFHGTTCANARSIRAYGFRRSTCGRLGPGVYLTVRNAAVAIAKHRGSGCVHSFVEVEVDIGYLKILSGNEDDRSGLWSSEGYDACRTQHPGWAGLGSFPEWCVADTSRLRIIG